MTYLLLGLADIPPENENQSVDVYSMITDHYTPVPERLKDWVSTPKSNGYESLHTTVMGPQGRFVEVQTVANVWMKLPNVDMRSLKI